MNYIKKLIGSSDVESTSTKLNIATQNLRIAGSYHSDGESYFTVENLYGQLESFSGFKIDGSVHHNGLVEESILNSHSLSIDHNKLPQKDESHVFSGKKSITQHKETIRIGTLILVSDELSNIGSQFDKLGYDCCETVKLCGDLHNFGVVDVHIENLYVIQ